MRLRHRMLWFGIVVFVSFVPVIAYAVERKVMWVFFVWFALVAALQFIVSRCPHCHRAAVITPSGYASPFVGTSCRYCGKDY